MPVKPAGLASSSAGEIISAVRLKTHPPDVMAAKAAKMKCAAVTDANHKSDKLIQIAAVAMNSLEEFNETIFKSL